MDLVWSKIAALLLLTALRLGFGLSPLIAIRSSLDLRKKQVDIGVSLCLCFGGGVLLATCFIHMIPEVRSFLSSFLPEHKFPLTELLVCAGFFLVHLVDEVIVAFTSSTKSPVSNRVSPIKRPPPSTGDRESVHDEQNEADDRPVRSLLVVLALSFHSFIEGLAIGLEESPTDVWFLFIAVAVHEGVILFSVGLDLVTSNVPSTQTTIYITVLALVSPAGLLVGLLLTGSEINTHSIAIAIVQGLAAGTILYVTFFEVLTRERYERCSSGLLAVLITLLGFLLMLALQLIGFCIIFGIVGKSIGRKEVADTAYKTKVANCVHEHDPHDHKQLDCQIISDNEDTEIDNVQTNFLEDLQY